MMLARSVGLLIVGASVAMVSAQSRSATDIHPQSFSRVPPVQRADLNDDGKRIWDYIGGTRGMPATGPAPVSMYSPKAAEPIHELNQYLRTTVAGSRYF